MNTILISSLVLGGIGILGAVVLYVVARYFHVEENPLVAEVEALLPGANCGACGCSGCHDFAGACVKTDTLEGLYCPGAGKEGMARIADLLGLAPVSGDGSVVVLRCAGTASARHKRADYDCARRCSVISLTGGGCLSCSYGCLGCGDCVSVCPFDAIALDADTGLPVVDEAKCVGCGKCATACPRSLLAVYPRKKRDMRVWVACSNLMRGADARKECAAACIGCGKCVKACPFEAVTVADNLATVDQSKCRLCRKCVGVCPVGAIRTVNFPVPLVNPSSVKVSE
ncbi:MAG: RnfABCDGE type electron transport complex subunit B [Muribaculaceae bacterium]|nr:RnfABCDGE type electron transport complex subunit B [Muribaculaceae bacterium]